MGTTFFATGLYFMLFNFLTVKTESYIGKIPTFCLSQSIHSNKVSAPLPTDANQVCLIISAMNGIAKDDSKSKSSLKPSGCCFSNFCSPICSASTAQLGNLGTFIELGSAPGLPSSTSEDSMLYDS